MKLLLFILIIFSSCHVERTWVVKSYAEDHGMFRVQATSGKKTREFIIECKPDSTGVKFKY